MKVIQLYCVKGVEEVHIGSPRSDQACADLGDYRAVFVAAVYVEF